MYDDVADMASPVLKIYSIRDILSSRPGENGTVEVEVLLTSNLNSDDNRHFNKDGWPLYAGEESWGFIKQQKSIFEAPMSTTGRITIKATFPVHKGMNFAFLNQQDTNGFTNEEIINAVKEFNRIAIYRWDEIPSVNSYNIRTADLNTFSCNPTDAFGTFLYKGAEVATKPDFYPIESSIETLGKRISDLEIRTDVHDSIIDEHAHLIDNLKSYE